MADDRDQTARLRLAKLLERAQGGDDAALSALCKELEPPLKGYFWRKFKREDVVEELCQESFIRFLKNFANIRDNMSLRSFVIKIATHVTQDYLRKKYRRPEESLETEPLDERADPSQPILQSVDLQRALEKLPPQSRRIMLLLANGYKYEEISAQTDLSVSGVKMQVKRNLAKLRSTLGVTILLLATTLLSR